MILPSKISVAKTIEINAPENEISMQINNFDQWANWFPLLKTKLGSIQIQNEENATILKNGGENIQVRYLTKTANSASFSTTIPSGSTANYTITVSQLPESVFRVNMVVNTNLKWYPWEKMKGIFLDKISGPQYEEALKNLKDYCESAR